MANKNSVEYIAGGSALIVQILKFKKLFCYLTSGEKGWSLNSGNFDLIFLFAGATQNSIRVAQVRY